MNEYRQSKNGNARKQILTAVLATVPTFIYGVQIGWLSPMGPLLTSVTSPAAEPIRDTHISWMATALPLSAICGVPFFSYSSDRFGRKVCVVAVSLLSCVSWILKLSSVTVSSLIAARVIAGLAAGGSLVVVPVYIKEISEDTWRGTLGSLNMTLCKLGVIFVYLVGMFASYTANQIVYLAISATHMVVFCFMPESPNYLLKIGKEDRAAKTISWLRSVKQRSKVVVDELAKLREEQRLIDAMPNITVRSVVNDKATFSALRMTLMLMVMQTLSGCFALMNYAADVFTRAGSQWSPNALAILMASLQLAGAAFTTVSIEKFGRKVKFHTKCCRRYELPNEYDHLRFRSASFLAYVCMATLATFLVETPGWVPATAVCVCFLFWLIQVSVGPGCINSRYRPMISIGPIPLGCSSLAASVCMATLATCFLVETAPGWVPATAVCVCFLFYGAGLAPVPFVIMAEVFTFQMRAKMAGVTMCLSFFCSSMTVLFYTPIAKQFGAYVVFYIFSAVTLYGVLYTILWVPETKGKSLREIQSFWKEPDPVDV